MSYNYRDEIINWYKENPIDRPLCVTFTVRQTNRDNTINEEEYEEITKSKLRQNFRHFMNTLNQFYFGNSFRRFNKRLRVFNVEEYGSGRHKTHKGRLHLHTLIQIPKDVSVTSFQTKIREVWSLKTHWGNTQIHFEEPKDHIHFGGEYGEIGWLRYSLKEIHKEENFITKSSSVDWDNTFI